MGYTKLDIKGIRVKALSSKKAKDKALEKAEKKVQAEKSKLKMLLKIMKLLKKLRRGQNLQTQAEL
jgi:hypothetical protein